MALVGEKFAFFHMPRTGGTWVRHALRIADPTCEEVGASHCPPSEVPCTPGKLRFTVLRECAQWLASWQQLLDICKEELNPGIPDILFVEDRARRLTEIHECYSAGVDLVLSTDVLDTELPRLLRRLGYDGNGIVAQIPKAARNRLET